MNNISRYSKKLYAKKYIKTSYNLERRSNRWFGTCRLLLMAIYTAASRICRSTPTSPPPLPSFTSISLITHCLPADRAAVSAPHHTTLLIDFSSSSGSSLAHDGAIYKYSRCLRAWHHQDSHRSISRRLTRWSLEFGDAWESWWCCIRRQAPIYGTPVWRSDHSLSWWRPILLSLHFKL